MDLGALFIGGSLLFIAGVVLASVVGAIEVRKLKASYEHWYKAYWALATENGALQRRHTSTNEQLEATRIALVAAQANDHGGDLGQYAKAAP